LQNPKRFGKGALPVQGRLAQLVEHLVYTERVSGSSPLAPTIFGLRPIEAPKMQETPFPFMLQKSLCWHFARMRGLFLTLGTGIVILSAGFLPGTAFARETEQAEIANCNDPRHRHVVVRPLTESLPVRKGEKQRLRRILM
jgi:hypothetical protein